MYKMCAHGCDVMRMDVNVYMKHQCFEVGFGLLQKTQLSHSVFVGQFSACVNAIGLN